jgi:hypothetical protein
MSATSPAQFYQITPIIPQDLFRTERELKS